MYLRSLTLENLRELENQGISVFNYDRARLEEKILHIGVGNFHRAHQALIFDFANRNGSDFGIVGVNLIPDPTLETALRTQNFLFSVTELDKYSEQTSIIGSLVSVTSNLEKFKFPVGLKVVTVTITQEGYLLDSEFGRLNWQIMPTRNIYGFLAELLKSLPQRIAVISCDNLSKNSEKLRSGLLEFLERTDPNLLPLVDDKFVFCCSVVDRITPKTDHSLVAKYLEPKGLNDLAPVFCEKYLSWIVEKKVEEFLPSIQDIPGVQIVEDLSVYESFKLTILNLNHFSIALFGIAQNIQFIHEVLEIPLLRYQIEKQIFYEIIPSLGRQYTSKAIRFAFETLNRFSNYKIPDNCARVARRSYHKLQSLLLPAIRTCLNSNLRPRHLLLNIALLCHLSRTNKLDSHISSINELKETLSDEDSELINILEKELSFLLDTVLLKGVDDAIKECQSLAA